MQELAADLAARASFAQAAAAAWEREARQAEAARTQNNSFENAVKAMEARSIADAWGSRAFSYGQQATGLMQALGWGAVLMPNGLAWSYQPGESEDADDAAYAAGVAERARALAEAGQSRDSGRNSSGGLRGLKGWNSTPNADDAARALKGGASRLGGEPAPEPPEPDAYKGPILTPREVEEGDDPSPASKANETDFDRAGLEAARASRQQALDALNREIAAREALSREIARSLEYGQSVLDRARRRLVQELHPDL